MAVGLPRLVITVVLIHVWLAFSSAEAVVIPTFEECSDFLDVFGGGCSGSAAAISSLILGTLVAAPTLVNLLVVAVQSIYVVFTIIEWVRGRDV